MFSRHFFYKIDTVFLCLYQAWTFQSHTPLCSRPSVTLKQVFCTRSSAQVWLTVRVASAIPHRHTLRQRINDIQVLSRYSVDIYQHILICTRAGISENLPFCKALRYLVPNLNLQLYLNLSNCKNK